MSTWEGGPEEGGLCKQLQNRSTYQNQNGFLLDGTPTFAPPQKIKLDRAT